MTTDLIARLEAATGPDRELDAAIAAFVEGGTVDRGGRFWRPGVRGFCIAPHYTASIDAALTLVPEGWGWAAGFDGGASVFGSGGSLFRGHATTPALAICIAALRARGEP